MYDPFYFTAHAMTNWRDRCRPAAYLSDVRLRAIATTFLSDEERIHTTKTYPRLSAPVEEPHYLFCAVVPARAFDGESDAVFLVRRNTYSPDKSPYVVVTVMDIDEYNRRAALFSNDPSRQTLGNVADFSKLIPTSPPPDPHSDTPTPPAAEPRFREPSESPLLTALLDALNTGERLVLVGLHHSWVPLPTQTWTIGSLFRFVAEHFPDGNVEFVRVTMTRIDSPIDM